MRVYFDIPGVDPTLPGVRIDELVIIKSVLANGYDCEVTLLGKVVGNLRIPDITIPSLVLLIQEAARAAWGAAKADIPVTDFNMTVNRGGNTNGGH